MLTAVQSQAIDPKSSIWLSAHAGTGKTKVLVDRILSLLINGVDPGSIVAITYTKAAAAEMQLRIRKRAAEWSISDEAKINSEIEVILQRTPNQGEIERARALLMLLTESSESLQIQTIHGFCQSLISRFPIEAGLAGVPEIMDDRMAGELLAETRMQLFAKVEQSADGDLAKAMQHIVLSLGDGGVQSVLDGLIAKSQELFAIWSQKEGVEHYRKALRLGIGIEGPFSLADWLAQEPLQSEQMPLAADVLMGGTKSDQALAAKIKQWHGQRNEAGLEDYLSAYLTGQEEPRKQIFTKAIGENHSALAEQLLKEQGWAYALLQAKRNYEAAELSEAVMQLGAALLAIYQSLKAEQGWLDFNDVIMAATQLLLRPGYCEWVLSKLDYQIQHVMIDEAQDTSPQQWALMQLLVEELFVPELYDGSPRTLFVVGDKKQSIYRFQGADAEGFDRNEMHYGQWFSETQQRFKALTLDQSFRSTDAVLKVVDSVCAAHGAETTHHLHRKEHAGSISLWPLLEPQERGELLPPWEVVAPDYTEHSAAQQLAEQIAEDVAGRIANGTAQAGDVLVLVQRRTGFIHMLTRELERRAIPVAGADRINLQKHLAVQDIMVLAEWCLLPANDLALATVLKGPLFNWSEETLFGVAHGRGEQSLWQALQEASGHRECCATLAEIKALSKTMRSYEWVCALLSRYGLQQSLRDQFGSEVNELLAELKNQLLQFEAQYIPDLQLFVRWMESGNSDIKREMEQGQNAVRIMTVHGAKGLQAPIVYLPDTVRVPTSRDTIIWQYMGAVPIAYVAPQGNKKSQRLREIQEVAREAELAEYNRLLYVALTRAEDELVITGYKTRQSPTEHCWYYQVERAMQQLGCEADENGMMCYASGTKPKESAALENQESIALPDWMNQSLAAPAPIEVMALSPSSLVEYNKAEGEELDGLGRTRGDITHWLLQLLPRQGASEDALLKAAKKLAPDYAEIEKVVQEVLQVWRQEQWLFAENSRAEVTLQGNVMWQGKPVFLRGQIDRLVIEEDRLVIIDYKSNRTIPEMIPETYAVQLAAYRALLKPLYPNHRIEAALLWTKDVSLQWADEELLETLCKEGAPPLDSTAA